MRVIIAGSRTIGDETYPVLEELLAGAGIAVSEVVSGCAPGVDRLGERWAKAHRVPVARFPADWRRHGRSAGFRRNAEMSGYGEALVALWDGQSSGTRHMIGLMARKGAPMLVWTPGALISELLAVWARSVCLRTR